MPNFKLKRDHAFQIFSAAVASVHPAHLLQQHLSLNNNLLTICNDIYTVNSIKNIYVIGAGKAVSAMAAETEKILGDIITGGLVTTKHGHALPLSIIKISEAAHPVPDESCVNAVIQTQALLKNATADDIVICLISGGASSLWCDVPHGITLKELQLSFELLIQSGATIHEINVIRKHLSYIKGGQLIRHCNGAKVYSFILSDVTTNDAGIIACGPTVASDSTFEDAYKVIVKHNLTHTLPPSVINHINNGRKGIIPETLKPDNELLANVSNIIIGNNRMAVEAAANKASALGYNTYIVTEPITDDAETEAYKLVNMAITHHDKNPACIIQGGETTVKVTTNSKGGRNQHFVLAAINEINKTQRQKNIPQVTILSGGTDGTDGTTNATGGIADTETLKIASEKQLLAQDYLTRQDAYNYLKQTDSLIITGPTQTNVMDIMMALIN